MPALVELCSRDCLEFLRRHDVGRVALVTPGGPRVVPVNYAVRGADVFFRTTPFSELGTYARHSEVAFEVDEIHEGSHAGISVVAYGFAEPIEDYDERREVQLHSDPKPWANGRRTLYFKVHIREVTGRRVGAFAAPGC